MWESTAQSTAAAAYAQKVKSIREPAEKGGEGPGKREQSEELYMDVYAHALFTNLPVGGVQTPPPPNYPSASLEGQFTALHVQLVLELLLLCWPDPQVPYVAPADVKTSPLESVARQRWGWLLLMCALLQQTSTEQKQLVLRERGPLLMQLLYQVLLEDGGLGGGRKNGLVMASSDGAWQAWYLAVTNDWLNIKRLPWRFSVSMAVTMVLQNLLFESLPVSWVDPVKARIGTSLVIPFGKCSRSIGATG
jgi:hypothetical protein